MATPTSTDGNTSIPDNKRNGATMKDGTVTVNRCNICGLEGYVIYNENRSSFDHLILSRNSQTVRWILLSCEGKLPQDTMIELLHSCSPSGTATTGPST